MVNINSIFCGLIICSNWKVQMNPFHADVWFLCPMKTSENLWFPLSTQYYISITPEILWCFQGIYKCIITKKWVNQKQKGKNEELNTREAASGNSLLEMI